MNGDGSGQQNKDIKQIGSGRKNRPKISNPIKLNNKVYIIRNMIYFMRQIHTHTIVAVVVVVVV